MMIEPVGSAMTYQAQSMPKAPEVAQQGNTEVSAANVEKAVDQTTPVVKAAEGKDGQNGDNAGEHNGAGAGMTQNQPSNEQIRKAVDQMNKKMQNSEAIFGIHDETNRVTIKIVDKESKEVIKELPPEKTLDMIAKVWEMAGILVDEKR